MIERQEDTKSYWMTLWKRNSTWNWKKYWIALHGELALEEAMDSSLERQKNENEL
jgi:hypothetical protein